MMITKPCIADFLCLNLTGAALASSSFCFGGGGSTRAASPHVIGAASPQPVARSSCGRTFVLPTRFRDAALIDQSRPASVGACGKLKHSVSRSSVTSMDSMSPPKKELAELLIAQNKIYLNIEDFGVGDISKSVATVDNLTNDILKAVQEHEPLKSVDAEDTPVYKIAEMVQSDVSEETPEMDQDHPAKGVHLLHQVGRRKTENVNLLH